LFSSTLNLCPTLSVSDQIWHPYKTTSKIIFSAFLSLSFWRVDGKTKDWIEK
jgi:hypothetical protein